ncbi:MAG TPA: hypothetical protein VFS32_05955 [Candidatus Limnocylindrales bacterium]|nr:hypothetical protein [Candidatus Limnocylindrales bacterium]
MADVDEDLITLLEDLVATLELREAADPDVPRWEADRRIRRLEDELVVQFRHVEHAAMSPALPESVLAGVF